MPKTTATQESRNTLNITIAQRRGLENYLEQMRAPLAKDAGAPKLYRSTLQSSAVLHWYRVGLCVFAGMSYKSQKRCLLFWYLASAVDGATDAKVRRVAELRARNFSVVARQRVRASTGSHIPNCTP